MRTTLWSPVIGDVPANLAFTNNFAAAADPTTANDSTQGYSAGSVWINGTSKTSFTCIDATEGAAVWNSDGQQQPGAVLLVPQGAPAAKTVSGTLTAADLIAGIITVTQGAGAASAQQLPLATALDTAVPEAAAGQAFDFSVINLGAASEVASLTTNTGWTLVGSMIIDIATAVTGATPASARFRARKTAAGAWTLYRIAS